ncbi:phage head spike fiber domain-containing protein [Salinibacter ruber]|uniref:phage head spike fiber domain-containing protein n=1 Tax=Salinibacter ruber TaxID=146919 RepID=UPI0011D1AC4E|nr:hypothetical protein [Salinibacter ruber]
MGILVLFLTVGRVHAQPEGPANAIAWAPDTPSSADLITVPEGLTVVPDLSYSRGESAGQYLSTLPDGRRYLKMVQVGNYIAQDGWVSNRSNPHDRTIATTLTENISAESRTSVAVQSLPYDLSDGHELLIQTGDHTDPPLTRGEGMIWAYVDGGVSQGATSIPIDDGDGNPVVVTASSGDRILSKWQSLWPIHAREEIKAQLGKYMNGFVDAGGDLDGIILDTELHIPATKGIKHDPRWDDSSMGIDGVSWKEKLSPVTIDEVINNNSGSDVDKWTKQIDYRVKVEALNETIFDLVKQYFPNIVATDWNNSGISESAAVPQSDYNAVWHPVIFGTHGNYGLYGSLRNLTSKTMGEYRDEGPLPYEYGRHPFAVTRWQVLFARTMYRENNGKVQPWLTYEQLCDAFYCVDVRNSPYYEELTRHLVLHVDPDVPFLYFNPHGDGASDDQQDLNVNSVLAGINKEVGGKTFSLHTTSNPKWTEDPLATAIDLSNKRLWRVTVNRLGPSDNRDITVNVSNGDQLTIPGGDVGAWYESTLNEDLTFSYTHPPVENHFPNDSFLDFTSNAWSDENGNTTVTAGISDPDGGSDAYKLDANGTMTFRSSGIPVANNVSYTFSVWVKGKANMKVFAGQNTASSRIGRFDPNFDGWNRTRITFNPGEADYVFIQFDGAYRTIEVYHPMLNKGEREGPYVSPEAPSPASQQISLRKGGNLVASAVDPTYPDLEAVLGVATSAIARIKTQDGQVFDPSEGVDEISVWDPEKAYTIYAETPVSFDVEGTALDSREVSLDEGWNWFPHMDDTSVAIDQAFDTIQNDLVMVKDEMGRVYRPAQNTNQIQSLQPGTAYKILLENPVTLSYPLE